MTNSEQDLLERIEKLTWYQSIPLGNGRVTPGETGESEKVKLDMMALPEDLSGKTLLDIGCNEGFFSFEAEKRGATRVLAMDKSPAAREKFMLLRKLFRSKVEFEAADLSGMSLESLGRFDIILFLAVFHHSQPIFHQKTFKGYLPVPSSPALLWLTSLCAREEKYRGG